MVDEKSKKSKKQIDLISGYIDERKKKKKTRMAVTFFFFFFENHRAVLN